MTKSRQRARRYPAATTPSRRLAAAASLTAAIALTAALTGCAPGTARMTGDPGIAGTLSAAGTAAPEPAALTRISTDPLTNTSGQHATESHPGIASCGRVIVSAFAEGLSKIVSGGASGAGFATSHDGGRSWIHGSLPGLGPGGPYSGIASPAVACDPRHHSWLIAVTAAVANPADPAAPPQASMVLVSRSADGGRTWSQPVTAAQARYPVGVGASRIACDTSVLSPHDGNCYAAFWSHDNAGGKKFIQMSVSDDGGMSWSAPEGTADHATATGGVPLVRPDGTVVVLINNWLPASPSTQLRSFTSGDGGRTWSASHLIAGLEAAPIPLNGLGSFDTGLTSAAVDGTGKIYAAWTGCQFRPRCSGDDVVMSTSRDGITWTAADRVTSGADAGTPGIGADPVSGGRPARLGITYYTFARGCQGAGCTIEARFVSSADGGASWSRPALVAGPVRGSWLATEPAGIRGVILTSEIGTTVLPGGNAVTAFPLAAPPAGNTLHQDMFAVRGGMPIRGG